MNLPAFSDLLREFIRQRITSIEQLEVLLLVYRAAPREWSAVTVARALRIDPLSAVRWLVQLTDQRLIASRTGDESAVYRYEGASPSEDRAIVELERAYAEERTALASIIVAPPVDDVQAFADAFRLRRTSDQGD